MSNIIMEKETFNEILNKKLFENSTSKLLKNISENPDRYVGLFRATKPKSKLIQNISQSREIKFGDALEEIFKNYFEILGYNILERKIVEDEDVYDIDQLFEDNDNDIVYLIEQKVRDDHDSTKKKGQFENFEKKYELVQKKYSDKTIIAIMWFIDDAHKKNKKFYTEKMENNVPFNNDKMEILYGEELFSLNLKQDFWHEFMNYLKEWKDSLPDFPELNLDSNLDENYKQFCTLTASQQKKLFSDDRIKEDILPIIFKENKILKKYIDETDTSQKRIRDVVDVIENYISE